MPETWVVVADSAAARFFVAPTPMSDLEERQDLVDPRARLALREIDTDRPGRAFDRAGEASHPMSPEVDASRTALKRCARTIANEIETARKAGRLERLVLVADPRLLGELRDCLTPDGRRLIVRELGKNLVHEAPSAIRARLPRPLWSELG